VSGLTGAAAGSAILLVVELGAMFAAAGFSFPSLLNLFMMLLQFSFTIFLIAFISSIVIVAPLSLMLERVQYRKAWPYYAVALAIVSGALVLIKGRIDFVGVLTMRDVALFIAVFVRRMKQYRRAAADEEARAPDNMRRLH